jgi:hypothetical protein
MSVKYVIEGNTITQVEEVSRQMVSLDGLLPGLTSYVPLELSPMPDGLKYIIIEPKEGLELAARLIVQTDPGPQRINHMDARASHSGSVPSENWRISVPYGLFWFEVNGNRMVTPEGEEILWTPANWGYMWSKDPYTDLDNTMVWPAMFPNCWENGRVCFGSTTTQANLPLGQFINAAINNFWTSEFNNDLERNWPYDNMAEWEAATSENPDVWREWGMWENGRGMTLRDKLNLLIDRYDNRNGMRVEWRNAVPSSTLGEIPSIRITPTWFNLTEWLDDLNHEDYMRLVAAIEAREA